MFISSCSYCNISLRPEHDSCFFCDECGYVCENCLEKYCIKNVDTVLKLLIEILELTEEEIGSSYKSICLKTALGDTSEFTSLLSDYLWDAGTLDSELCPTCNSKDSVFLSDCYVLEYLGNIYDIDVERVRDELVNHNGTISQARDFVTNKKKLPEEV